VLIKIAGLQIVRSCLTSAALFLSAHPAASQQDQVTAQVHFGSRTQDNAAIVRGNGEVVVWLKPLDRADSNTESQPKRHKLVQIHKTFEPHTLVVQIGSVVEFPNHDPFFHNVFSLFEGKRFDLGLYEAGATNSVRFDRPGVSFLFCNIHPEMSAVVVSVDTPYYGLSDASGKVTIANVPDGKYEVHYWSERGLPDSLRQQTRTVTISNSTRNLSGVQIAENPNFTTAHKNKYGQDYAPPPHTDYARP
jgi:plastocyanin